MASKKNNNTAAAQLEADMLLLQKEQPAAYDIIMSFVPKGKVSKKYCDLLQASVASGYRKFYSDGNLPALSKEDLEIPLPEEKPLYSPSYSNIISNLNESIDPILSLKTGRDYLSRVAMIVFALDKAYYPDGCPLGFPLSFIEIDDEKAKMSSGEALNAVLLKSLKQYPFLKLLCSNDGEKIETLPFWTENLCALISVISRDTDISNVSAGQIPEYAKKMIAVLQKATKIKKHDVKLKTFFADHEGIAFFYCLAKSVNFLEDDSEINSLRTMIFYSFILALLKMREEQHAGSYQALNMQMLEEAFGNDDTIKMLSGILEYLKEFIPSFECIVQTWEVVSQSIFTKTTDEWHEDEVQEVYDFDDDIPIYKLRVKLRGARASMDILIRADQTFQELHNQIFFAFDRWEEQSYRFEIKEGYNIVSSYGDNSDLDDFPADDAYIGHHLLAEASCRYLFDDGYRVWEHDVKVSDILPPDPEGDYPKILKISGKVPSQNPNDKEIRGMD